MAAVGFTGLHRNIKLPFDFGLTRHYALANITQYEFNLHATKNIKMRLSQHTQQIIRDTVREVFGVEARVKLFGSRTNDDARGGDIDLLVELPSITAEVERKTMQLTARLQLRIGDQPIDVLVIDPSTPQQSIHEQASITGISL